MEGFLTALTVVAIVCFYVWINERNAKKEAVEAEARVIDRVLRDAVIRYPDGTILRFYEAKPIVSGVICKSYSIHPDVRVSNMMELQAILKYKEHLSEQGLEVTVEEAAKAWIELFSDDWRRNYMSHLTVLDGTETE